MSKRSGTLSLSQFNWKSYFTLNLYYNLTKIKVYVDIYYCAIENKVRTWHKQFIKVLQLDKSLFKYHSNSSKHRFKCHNGSKTEPNTELNTENSRGSFTANYFSSQLLFLEYFDYSSFSDFSWIFVTKLLMWFSSKFFTQYLIYVYSLSWIFLEFCAPILLVWQLQNADSCFFSKNLFFYHNVACRMWYIVASCNVCVFAVFWKIFEHRQFAENILKFCQDPSIFNQKMQKCLKLLRNIGFCSKLFHNVPLSLMHLF